MDQKNPMVDDHLLIRAARRERTERTPVWFMRQAGRCDPAYRELRQQTKLPLEVLFRDADLATQISCLPVRFGVDAVIIFQDILTLLGPMGAEFVFRPGPCLDKPLEGRREIDALRPPDPSSDLSFVGQTIRQVRQQLDGKLPVLGFAGAPLTLAFFLLAGKSPMQNAELPRHALETSPADVHRLLDKLTDATISYLAYQIQEGVDAFQLFESCADMLTPEQYAEFAHPYHLRIFSELKGKVPAILFAKEQPDLDLMVDSGADVISIGRCLDLASCKEKYGDRVAFQGNLDNTLLATGSVEELDDAVRRCVLAGGRQGHIFNLNHGVLEHTPLERVQRVIRIVREVGQEMAQQTVEKAGLP